MKGWPGGWTLAAILAASTPAAADEAPATVEGRAFYKTMGAGYALPQDLVDVAAHLSKVTGQDATLPRSLAANYHSARAWGRLLVSENLDFSAGWQLTAAMASDAALLGASGSGLVGGAAPASLAPAKRRLVDFDPYLLSRPTLRVGHNLDLLNAHWRSRWGDVTVGRQALAWGSGRFWNPTDRLAPFAPSDIDREVRRGVDAVRWTVPLGVTALVDMLWLPQKEAGDQSGVVRAQANALGWDGALVAAKYVDVALVGADVAGDVGPVAVHAEAALSGPWGSPGNWRENTVVRGVVGGDWRPAEKWLLMGEYLFDGGGTTDPGRYLRILRDAEHLRGEWFGAGRHRTALAAAYRWSELLSITATALVNCTDPSAMLLPSAEWWFEQNVLVRAGVYLPVGRGVDARAVTKLQAADLLTPAGQAAAQSLGIQSEYGMSPWGGFLQVGIYR
ncbi:MAG: hypothetical protein HY902_20860 [Deltaproteobacteria bacterium]|nr:hypothetical protein [Deltaproteobacteria bacterium]